MTEIAIIGGGAAGAAVFGALLRHGGSTGVHWIAGPAANGRGVAYATADERHLLNVRASGMGLYPDQDEEFAQFAADRRAGAGGADFLSRRLFGDFIEAQVQRRSEAARRQGRRFAVHRQEAVHLERQAGGYRVHLADGTAVDADVAVLALGALAQRPLRAVSGDALASGAYELDPWRLPQRTHAPRRLLVIGTGLTAADTLLSAAYRWPHAELVAVSRHGLLPLAHSPLPLAPYPWQQDLNDSLLACTGVAPMLRLVRTALRTAPQTDWRSVIDGMRPVNARLWQGLTLARRKQFLRHLRWLWEAARHRTAPQTAQTLQQLLEEGRLQVHAARVLAVDGHGPLEVGIRDRASQARSTLRADLVVQATGLDTAAAYTGHVLLSQLLRDGLAVADPLQLGVAAQPDGRLLDAHGDAQPGLYAIGSLLRGNLWECTAMPEIRAAAHALAQALAQAGRSAGDATDGGTAPPRRDGTVIPFPRHNDMAFGEFAET
ncbi:FAD/NAD(P)-binding protein [Fulvimonas sp. R45]|uniref:FAD/NAD(P)-binding protein n=1 Tax=Fulvimonas sp. R45 TaxID=3045937 RepID=UPI00265E19E9|nr:FAD/NAD(P)-binding protein [Fulvimonas sp. R45]MDO1529317.1 FAD/NAD(P)-binding protein [Fulvimonas sp. R45]